MEILVNTPFMLKLTQISKVSRPNTQLGQVGLHISTYHQLVKLFYHSCVFSSTFSLNFLIVNQAD